tara:strand:- start:1000 stop:1242 length:243 start_codon:yes stop_codon:yes gene_type:complete
MNQTTTGENKKDKTFFDYILENKTTIIVFLGMLVFLYFIRDTRAYIEVDGEKIRQNDIPADELKLGGAIKNLKSQLRNVK